MVFRAFYESKMSLKYPSRFYLCLMICGTQGLVKGLRKSFSFSPSRVLRINLRINKIATQFKKFIAEHNQILDIVVYLILKENHLHKYLLQKLKVLEFNFCACQLNVWGEERFDMR